MRLVSLGVSCSVWSGCWASVVDDRVIMACAAMNGYHSVVSYSWLMNRYICRGENTPLLYTAREGKYSCKVTNQNLDIDITSNFAVQSKPQGFLLGTHYVVIPLIQELTVVYQFVN